MISSWSLMLSNYDLYKTSLLESKEVKKKVYYYWNKGPFNQIHHYAMIFVLVSKKDGTQHICVDFKDLKNIIIKNWYIFHEIYDLIYQFQGAYFFGKLELKSIYDKVESKGKAHQIYHQYEARVV